MKDDLKRELKGKVDNIKGRMKEAIGSLSGNKRTQAEGTVERAAGAANEKVGEAEGKLDRALGQDREKGYGAEETDDE
jgi:uncharacterized protein YjbJ (UPF0337 family)